MAKETLEEFLRDPDGEVGRPYRGWREGEFDAHLIDVGIAEAFFHDGALRLRGSRPGQSGRVGSGASAQRNAATGGMGRAVYRASMPGA